MYFDILNDIYLECTTHSSTFFLDYSIIRICLVIDILDHVFALFHVEFTTNYHRKTIIQNKRSKTLSISKNIVIREKNLRIVHLM